MAQNNKKMARKASVNRDKIYKKMEFNRNYPLTAKAEMDDKLEQKMKLEEAKSRKKLLPLEVAALDDKDQIEASIMLGLEPLKKKQVKPRRAINWEYTCSVQNGKDEAEAAKIRDEKLAKLDLELNNKEEELRKKYKELKSTPEAKKLYADTQCAEDKRLQDLRKSLSDRSEEKLNSIAAKLNKKNEILKKSFDEANEKVASLSEISSEEFGKNNILSIRNLKMYFSGIKAVDDVSFNVKKGEIFGLIGPNGAGKTTLFNCITQFYKPTDGKLYYEDRFGNVVNLENFVAHDVIGMGIARTFQNIELVYFLTIEENLLVGAHAKYNADLLDHVLHTRKLLNEEKILRRKALYILDKLGILGYKDAFPMGLPYGILKKVELARTLMSDPRCIILDEPAAGLNDAETEELAEMIKVIRDEFKCTILLVEHDMNLVMSICDTICAISFGKMLAIGTPDEIQNNAEVQKAYLGSD